MSIQPDLSAFDLAALERRTTAAARRQDRFAREAASIGVPVDCPATHQSVTDAGTDAATLADLARLVAELRRSGSGTAGRTSPVLRIVPPAPAPRAGIFARTMAAFGRPAVPKDRRKRPGVA